MSLLPHYLGIEIGGTKLQLGLGPGDGTVTGLWRGEVDVARGPEGIRRQIVEAVPALLSQSEMRRGQVVGCGIGFGGPVDDTSRTVIKSHQIEGWDDFPLADWISELLGWPSVLANDADVAGLAEAHFGAGRNFSPVFYITIGSGVGGGFILNGDIYRGCGRGAGEIGHLAISDKTAEGVRFRPLEDFVSGWALERQWREIEAAQGAAPGGGLARNGGVEQTSRSAEQIAVLALQGQVVARRMIDTMCNHLAWGICQMIGLLCPRRIIIGGGVSRMGEELLFNPLRRKVADQVFRPFVGCYDIVPAELGEEVVVHGALALARRQFGGH
jgi:glucokinase